jgi:anti-anti-sigma factor
VVGSANHVLILSGEIDRISVAQIVATHRDALTDVRPVVLECSAVTYMDSRGLELLLDVLDRRPDNSIANPSWSVVRLFRMVHRHDLLFSRTRHAVAIASGDGVDGTISGDIADLLAAANRGGCTYDLHHVRFESALDTRPLHGRRWSYLVVPPLDAWIGLSVSAPLVRWIGALSRNADRVLGIGTGLFVLAAAGCLDGHQVAAGSMASALVPAAPRSLVTELNRVSDGRLDTASTALDALTLCADAVERDYGEQARRRIQEALTPQRTEREVGTDSIGARRTRTSYGYRVMREGVVPA